MRVKVLRVLLVGLLLAACTSPAPTRTALPLSSPSATVASTTTPSSPPVSSPTPAAGQQTWSEVLKSGGASAVMRADDVPTAALAFGDGYLLAGNTNVDQSAVIWQSPDGVTWQRIDDGPSFADSQLSALLPIPGGVLAVGQLDSTCFRDECCNSVDPNRLWTSTDGVTWRELPDNAVTVFAHSTIQSLTAGPQGLVLFGETSGPTCANLQTTEWTSTDGRTWHVQRQFATAFPNAVVTAVSAMADGYVALGRDTLNLETDSRGLAWFSTDGRSWVETNLDLAGSELTHAVVDAAGVLAFVLPTDPWWASPDGRSWQQVPPSVQPFLHRATTPMLMSDGSRIVAVVGFDHAGTPVTWTSGDGLSWQALPSTNTPSSVTAIGDGTVGAIGPLGTVLATNAQTSTGGSSNTVWVLH